eukprot:1552384-Amphidinium_carterae.1
MKFWRRELDHSRPSAYKDLCVVFIGDNAQGDCDTTAKRMSEFTRGGQLGMKALTTQDNGTEWPCQRGRNTLTIADSFANAAISWALRCVCALGGSGSIVGEDLVGTTQLQVFGWDNPLKVYGLRPKPNLRGMLGGA